MQINNNYNRQSFGMAYSKMWDSTQSALQRRISNKDWSEFEKLISAQEKNKNTDILLISANGIDKLSAQIRHGREIAANMDECLLLDFNNPLRFLKRVNKKADMLDKKLGPVPDKNNIFTKLK